MTVLTFSRCSDQKSIQASTEISLVAPIIRRRFPRKCVSLEGCD